MTFASLTYDEQVAHLTAAARLVLPRYGLNRAEITLLSYLNNIVFKVTASSGQHFVLRMHRPGHKRIEWIESEVLWLSIISQQSAMQVPHPVATTTGEWLTEAMVETLDEPLPCVLFQWIEGHFYSTSEIPLGEVSRAAGFIAGLHEFAAAHQPPENFTRPTLDWEGFFGEQSPYNPGEGARIFTADQKAVFGEIEAEVQNVFHELDALPDAFGVIHADFLPKNFLFTESGVAAIDFDDLSWGYFLYDLSPTLLLFKAESRYPALREAWLAGYSAVRALPPNFDHDLEAFMAARLLASCLWQAGHLHNPRVREHAAEVIAGRTEDLKRFLQTGRL
ncbi:MAG: phosphotransferase [Chloroflexi bacterium]|nr:phosphotransferase [Chloroflexota bacterium]MCC6893749.1 phosphotransferase [Anaerolineae bacterium]